MHLEGDDYFTVQGQYFFNRDWLKQAHQRCYRLTEAALHDGLNVVVANTFTRAHEVQGYINLASQFSADIKVYRCAGQYGSIHNVPEHVMENMRGRFGDWVGEEIINE